MSKFWDAVRFTLGLCGRYRLCAAVAPCSCHRGAMTSARVRMTVYAGKNRVTPVSVDIEVVTPGVGRTGCLECHGTGWWAFAEPEIPGEPCVACKGTGRIWVSIRGTTASSPRGAPLARQRCPKFVTNFRLRMRKVSV
jgi:hypothetical protein